uniref:Trafficking protein particle complex subunit 12 n=1 Tax=Schistosoma haematobium TaxID=6185 RepID=A0A095AY56_SCHHA
MSTNCRQGKVEVSDSEAQSHSILSNYFTEEINSDDPFGSVCDSKPNELTKSPSNTDLSKCSQLDPKQDVTSLNRLRQRDAWLPSESTQKALLSPSPENKLVEVKPILMGKDYEIGGSGSTSAFDPFHYLLAQYTGDEPNVNAIQRVPSIELRSQSGDDLKKLINNGWYTCALNLTYRILSAAGFKNDESEAVLSPYTAQIWLCRLALLVRTQNYKLAEHEFATFHNMEAPNFYFEYSPQRYPGRTGSIIPFSLRLLHAELPFNLNRTNEALDRLYYLLAIIGRIQSNLEKGFREDGSISEPDLVYRQASLNLWTARKIRVLSSCLSIFLHKLDYQSALNIVRQLTHLCSDNQVVLRGFCSLLGRVHLQLYDSGIYLFFSALLSIGKGEYEEARMFFETVLQLDPTNVAAANNLAICSLYVGRLSKSIEVLEDLTTTGLTSQPINNLGVITTASTTTGFSTSFMFNARCRRFCLHDVMISNLAVLYEVESDLATLKKVNLLKKLIEISGEPVHISSFKLSMKQ